MKRVRAAGSRPCRGRGRRLVVALSVLIGWLVLWLIRMRPAWPVALLGPVLGWVIAWLGEPVLEGVFGHSVGWLVLPFALGYGVAGLASARWGT